MHYAPWLSNSTWPQALSTLYRCSLSTMAQDKPHHEKPSVRDCCTLFGPYSTVTAGISSSSFVQVSTRQLAVSSLSKGISSTYWQELDSQPHTPKARVVSIELTWLLNNNAIDNSCLIILIYHLLKTGTIFQEVWKRKTARLAYEWDVDEYEDTEPDRPEFYGTKERPVSICIQEYMESYPAFKKKMNK